MLAGMDSLPQKEEVLVETVLHLLFLEHQLLMLVEVGEQQTQVLLGAFLVLAGLEAVAMLLLIVRLQGLLELQIQEVVVAEVIGRQVLMEQQAVQAALA